MMIDPLSRRVAIDANQAAELRFWALARPDRSARTEPRTCAGHNEISQTLHVCAGALVRFYSCVCSFICWVHVLWLGACAVHGSYISAHQLLNECEPKCVLCLLGMLA